MIHYHGTPFTPRAVLLEHMTGKSFCVPWPEPRDVDVCHEIGEGVMLDNGAFSYWRNAIKAHRDSTAPDWAGFYAWAEPWLDFPTTWAVIPDVIDGDEAANDALLEQWPFGSRGAPVWHMHEPVDRLLHLADGWSRVCIGSSGAYADVGDVRWHRRMQEAMDALCGNGPVPVWLHMLRGLDLAGSDYPFASADSTNVAQNYAGGHRQRPRHPRKFADEMDARQCPARWRVAAPQLSLEEAA